LKGEDCSFFTLSKKPVVTVRANLAVTACFFWTKQKTLTFFKKVSVYQEPLNNASKDELVGYLKAKPCSAKAN